MARDPEALRAALVSELVPVIDADTDPQTWDPRELPGVGGNVWKAVIWQERIWYRDEDSLVDHDGLTCIRLLDGVAYLTNDVKFPGFVLSRTLETPPDEEDRAYGDTHRVPAGATDEWAGHENENAMWTARGYRFRAPVTGDLHYVVDESGYEHFNDDDEWKDGFGALVFENGSVRPDSLLIRSWSVENQTTNILPDSGPAGEQYIVGPSPTGAAIGQSKKIAWRPATDAAFIFTAPFVGEKVHDKALGIEVKWTGTAWIPADGVWVGISDSAFVAGAWSASTIGGGSFTAYSFSNTTPPSISQHGIRDNNTISYKANRAGARLRVTLSARVLLTTIAAAGNGGNGRLVVALFRDSESDAISWVDLGAGVDLYDVSGNVLPLDVSFGGVTASDSLAHSYHYAIMSDYDSSLNRLIVANSVSRRDFTIEEAA